MTWLIVFCSLVFVLGLIAGIRLGMWLEERAAARDLAEERAEVEADKYVGQLVEPPEVAREGLMREQMIRSLEARGFSFEAAAEERAHEEQALALANPYTRLEYVPVPGSDGRIMHMPVSVVIEPETDEEFSARLARTADEIIAWAGEQAYLAGEHWKRP